MTFSAFVMIGTGEGTGGLGRGRGETIAQAVSVALNIAKKNLISIEMHRGCSVSHDATYKYKRSKVVIRACRTGYGIRASPEMRIALEAFGLRDICVVTVGRTTNRQALYRALFKGLQTDIRTIENLSKSLGKKYLDIHKFFYYKNE